MSSISKKKFTKETTNINPEWIYYFIILAELKDFKYTATHLNITDSALKKAILKIEEQFGCKLIETEAKRKNKFVLTFTGERFLEKARVILQNLYDLNKTLSVPLKDSPGIITIGMSSLWQSYFPDILANFLETFPNIYPKAYYLYSHKVESLVASGIIDVGLITQKPQMEGLKYFKGPSFRNIIVGKPQKMTHWSKLSYIDSISDTGSRLMEIWPDHIYKRKIVINSGVGLKSFCMEGLGAVFISELSVKDELEKGTLAEIAEPPFEYNENFHIVWNKNIHQSPELKAFIDIAKKSLNR